MVPNEEVHLLTICSHINLTIVAATAVVEAASHHGMHLKLVCTKCEDEKRSDLFIKGLIPPKCKVCYKDEQTKLSGTPPTNNNTNNNTSSNNNNNTNSSNNNDNDDQAPLTIARVNEFDLGKRSRDGKEKQ
jgi:hypothetical protein